MAGKRIFVAAAAVLAVLMPAHDALAIRGPRALHRWESIASFRQIQPGIGWVQTDRGHILLTTNQGRSWRNLTPPAMHRPRSGLAAFFLDPEHGWVLRVGRAIGRPDGSPHRVVVWRTSDGGISWAASRFALRTPAYYGGYSPIAVSFSDPLNGWAAFGVEGHLEDYGADIARTSDGGLTWRVLGHSPFGGASQIPSAIALSTSLDAVSVGPGPPGRYSMASSQDGGITWRRRPLHLPKGCPPDAGASFSGPNGLVLLACQRGGREATLGSTSDGGRTWSFQRVPASQPTLASVLGPSTWTLALDPNHLLVTTDAGARWRRIRLYRPVSTLPAPQFLTPSFAWAASSRTDRLISTRDGGRRLKVILERRH